jgi:fibro-slime domain-containing protein
LHAAAGAPRFCREKFRARRRAARACSNVCGQGSQLCAAGYWQPCVVAPVTDFTLATKFTFHYLGGEVFRFTGDDDLWVFVNRHLAIDLGGVHQSKTGEVYLDDHKSEFGITPGNTYQLHLFFAERHVINSDFSVETTIADPGTCQ